MHAGTASEISGVKLLLARNAGGNWQLNGNAGIDEDETCLGTSDDNPLSIRTNELELPTGPDLGVGDLSYYNGAEWQRVPAGSEGQVLTMSGGVPTWVGGGDIGSLLQVTLSGGQTLYVHPEDQDTGIPESNGVQWGGYREDLSLDNHLSTADALADFDGENNTATIVAEWMPWGKRITRLRYVTN